MQMSAVLDSIATQRAIPVLRCGDPRDAVATGRACARGGMSVIELTCTTPHVESAIAELTDDGLIVGLGTITTAERVRSAAGAGASFVVSFCDPEGFVAAARAHDVAAVPGAMTPTEVQACHDAGADAVKIFPAEQLAPGYLRHLSAVMPDAKLMVTGGLRPSVASLSPWLSAGAMAVGLGMGQQTVAEAGEEQVRLWACRALDAVAGCQSA